MLVFDRIKDKNHPYFEQAFTIYEKSFPAFERRSKRDQIAALSDKEYHFTIIKNEQGELLGIQLTWNKQAFIYLEHFAITPLARGNNIGTRALQTLKEVSNKTIILEIDPPTDKVSSKREEFYLCLGFTNSNKTYVHPSYQKETIAHTLVMMFYPVFEETVYKDFQAVLSDQIMQYSEVDYIT